MWTKFIDMATGGYQKTDYAQIFLELSENEARKYFKDKFGIDPENVTCDCCGSDFEVDEMGEEPIESGDTLIIRKSDIKT